MPRSQVDDANEGRPCRDGGAPEGEVVGDNHAAGFHGAVENVFVRRADEAVVRHGPDVAAAFAQTRDHLGPDVSSVRSGKSNGFTP